MGIICPIGRDADEVGQSLANGRPGIAMIEAGNGETSFLKGLDKSAYVAAVPYSNADLQNILCLDPGMKYSRTFLLGLYAVRSALKGFPTAKRAGLRGGLIAGGTVGGMDITEHRYHDLTHPERHTAELFCEHDIGSATARIAADQGISAFHTTISTACSSSANAIILGCRMLKHRFLDYVLVGGMDPLTSFTINGFSSLMIYDPLPCRPFDLSRQGLNLGEGAAFLLLRRSSDLEVHEGSVRISGYANRNDAYHQTASSDAGRGAYHSMSHALEHAGISPGDIGYINAHGTGTANNDNSELKALDGVFRNSNKVIPYSSTKSFTGHTLAAAGAIEAVISATCIQKGFIPANLRLESPIPTQKVRPALTTEYRPLDHVLSNSFGFGGNCTSIVISKTSRNG